MELRQSEFETIDRSLLVLKPTKVFLDWCNQVEKKLIPEKAELLTFEDFEDYKNAYLIPEIEDDRQLGRWLKKNFEPIFYEELSSWYQAPEFFPSMDLKTFKRFFEIELIEMVFDLG